MRILLLLLAAPLLLVGFTGCGNDQPATKSAATMTTAAAKAGIKADAGERKLNKPD